MNEDNALKYFLPVMQPNLVRGTEGASGYDLRAAVDCQWILEPGQRCLVPTGLHLEMPKGVEAQIRSRSGMANSFGVCVLNAPGTIDSDYRGEVKVNLINLGREDFAVNSGERIAQLVFAPVFADHVIMVPVAEGMNETRPMHLFAAAGAVRGGLKRVQSLAELSDTARGPGGFGSTGRK